MVSAGYTGTAVAHACERPRIELEDVSGPKPAGGIIVQPRRGGVERTNAWINRNRRLVRQDETTLTPRKASSSSAKSPCYWAASTVGSCSTGFSPKLRAV
jgi:hypothetical protein